VTAATVAVPVLEFEPDVDPVSELEAPLEDCQPPQR